MSDLHKRMDSLEARMGAQQVQLPAMIVHFVDAARDGNGLPRPGACAGGIRLEFGKPPQRLDADMQPITGQA